MNENTKLRLKSWLHRFPFVKWDRFIDLGYAYSIYGWIEREDSYKDFLVLEFSKKEQKIIHWISSSVIYDNKITSILGNRNNLDNVECERVEKYIDLPNVIKLFQITNKNEK